MSTLHIYVRDRDQESERERERVGRERLVISCAAKEKLVTEKGPESMKQERNKAEFSAKGRRRQTMHLLSHLFDARALDAPLLSVLLSLLDARRMQ